MNKETLRREYIFSAFYHLLKKNNYDDISVCDITTKAGVSRMSFYRNFKSKDDLTFQSIDRIAKAELAIIRLACYEMLFDELDLIIKDNSITDLVLGLPKNMNLL